MLPKCCNYAWFVLQKWGTLAVHNRIMYCLAAYAVCVLQRFKKCAAQTFLFLFTNPQNYICCYCAVNIVWEDCICTAESSPLRYWYCICADGTCKKLQQLSASIDWMCVWFFFLINIFVNWKFFVETIQWTTIIRKNKYTLLFNTVNTRLDKW